MTKIILSGSFTSRAKAEAAVEHIMDAAEITLIELDTEADGREPVTNVPPLHARNAGF